MWTGVTKGLAGLKFSGSLRRLGERSTMDERRIKRIKNPVMSLVEKYVWNGVLSKLDSMPVGFLEPVWWRNRRWIIESAVIIKGKRKWNAKNRFKVALSTENPPHIHWTIEDPRYGTAETRLVITVAPQNDICPHGRTYPTKAVSIVRRRRITPMFQVSLLT